MDVNNEKEENFLGNASEIYLFLIGLFVIIFSFSACILLIYSLYKHHSVKNIINYPTILSAIFYFISSVVFISALSYFNENDNNNFENDDAFVVCMVLFVTFLCLAKLSIYTQFLARLWSSFKNSLLALNKITIIISITLLCLLFITVIWWIILIILRYLALNHEYDGYYDQFYPVFLFLFIFDFCLSWLVVGLLINKLFKTIMFRSRSDFFAKMGRNLNAPKTERNTERNTNINDMEMDEYEDEEKEKVKEKEEEEINRKRSSIGRQRRNSLLIDLAFASINESDKKRLDVITRQFILSSLSIVTTQICYISFIIILIVRSSNPEMALNQNVLYAVYGGVFYPMEVVLNCMSLYLNYSFALKYYDFWCKCCHQRCSLFVVRRASENILRRHSHEITTINVHRSLHDQ